MAGREVRVPVPRYRPPQVAKLSAGYYAAPGMDLIDLFIGSEGTLGIVTEATLRVLPVRPAMCLAFVPFAARVGALACVRQLRGLAHSSHFLENRIAETIQRAQVPLDGVRNYLAHNNAIEDSSPGDRS